MRRTVGEQKREKEEWEAWEGLERVEGLLKEVVGGKKRRGKKGVAWKSASEFWGWWEGEREA